MNLTHRLRFHRFFSAPFLVVLFGTAGIAFGVALLPGWTSIDARADAPPAQVEPTVRAERRCPHCGWIESKREILAGVADPRALMVYGYTVRMADGSSGVFREELPVLWRLGEQLIFIGGAGPLAAPAAPGNQRN